jgi:replicative DNA helicase
MDKSEKEKFRNEVESWEVEKKEIQEPENTGPIKEKISLDKFLEGKFKRDQLRDPDKPTGFYLNDYKKLQAGIDGLREGFYLIGAESNVGKTAMLVNLCMNVIESNTGLDQTKKAKCLYFSIDDSRERIIERIYSRATNINLWEIYKRQTQKIHSEAQAKAKDDLIKYYQENRIDLFEMSTASEIIKTVKQEQSNGHDLVVIIDGLSYLNVSGFNVESMKENELTKEIKQAEFMKELAIKYKVPAIGTVEVKKPTNADNKTERTLTIHDIKGSTTLPFRADFVLLLHPTNLEKFYDPKETIIDLIGFIGKNKLGQTKGTIDFIHSTNIAKIEQDNRLNFAKNPKLPETEIKDKKVRDL